MFAFEVQPPQIPIILQNIFILCYISNLIFGFLESKNQKVDCHAVLQLLAMTN
ncbi:hypothetical protein HFN_0057 [Helicobacter fennelliae MRY12-0050]|uniref:Uncharacterized protein n=1 Tax=Helicobacter fennelliae MRY12-0050 TaxID=1325130 RepID=T1D169_9HELI|nr:hypothetical protein HFN_0057 [Helicobacter fennelliae MRY12-0050]